MIVGVDFCCISVATKGCEAACPGRWQNLLELFAEEKPVPNQCWNLPNLKVDTMGWNWNGQLCLQLLCSSLKPQLMSWGGGRKQPPKNLIPKVDSQLSVPLSSFQMNMEISIDCTISIYNGQTKIFFSPLAVLLLLHYQFYQCSSADIHLLFITLMSGALCWIRVGCRLPSLGFVGPLKGTNVGKGVWGDLWKQWEAHEVCFIHPQSVLDICTWTRSSPRWGLQPEFGFNSFEFMFSLAFFSFLILFLKALITSVITKFGLNSN